MQTCTVNYRNALDTLRVHMNIILFIMCHNDCDVTDGCTAGSDTGQLTVNVGTHLLPLFSAPVPDVRTMITHSSPACSRASVKMRVFVDGNPSQHSSTSEDSDSDDDDDDAGVDEVGAFHIILLAFFGCLKVL